MDGCLVVLYAYGTGGAPCLSLPCEAKKVCLTVLVEKVSDLSCPVFVVVVPHHGPQRRASHLSLPNHNPSGH